MPELVNDATGGAAIRRVYAFALVAFTAAAAVTVWMSRRMTGGMAMPGHWQMSMLWMPMAGTGWLGASLMFLGMWLTMMVAMMLPSVLPLLTLYQRTLVFRGDTRPGRAVVLAGIGYFAVWLAFGALAYLLGIAISHAAMASSTFSRTVPGLAGSALLIAGLWQFTPWKSACLAHCRHPLSDLTDHLGQQRGSLRLGLQHGAWCAACCWGVMLAQLTLGVMSLGWMLVFALWIVLEKLAPFGPRLSRPGGALAMAAGLWLMATRLLT